MAEQQPDTGAGRVPRLRVPIKTLYIGAALLLAAALALAAALRCTKAAGPAESRRVAIALPLQPPSALLMIAQERGMLAGQGLEVEMKQYVSGKLALAGLFSGEADVAAAADVPIAFAAFERDDFRVFATIGQTDDEPRMIARKDKGILKPADLAGKRIGTQKASAVHFFLHLFLLHHRIPADAVTLVFLPAEELPRALLDGKIDAFSMREPFIGEAREKLGERAVVFAQPGIYYRTDSLVCTASFARDRSGTLGRIVRALLLAEDWAAEHPDEAVTLVARRLGAERERIAALWPDLDLRVSLDQSLVVSLEDESRWILKNGYTEARALPNFLKLISMDALDAAAPGRVTIIR